MADVNLTLVIREEHIARVTNMLDVRFNRRESETYKGMLERILKVYIRNLVEEYEKDIASQIARDSVVIPSDILE